MSQDGRDNGSPREDLLRRSQDTRNKLVRAVARLDERRHEAFDVRKQLQRHLKQLAIGVGLVIVGTAATSAFVMHRLMTAGKRRRTARWRLAKAAWTKPERGLRAQRGSFVTEVLRSLALTLATSLLGAPLRRAVRGSPGPGASSPAR
jgi:hypothetical protein